MVVKFVGSLDGIFAKLSEWTRIDKHVLVFCYGLMAMGAVLGSIAGT